MSSEMKLRNCMEKLAQSCNPKQETSAIVMGEIISSKPLKVKILGESKIMEVCEEFLMLSFLCKKYVLPKEHVHNVPPHENHAESWNETLKETEEIELWRGIKTGDKVSMIRLHGGQMYYILERLEMEGTKDDSTDDKSK